MRRQRGERGPSERGSVVLFALFVCLAVAVAVQTLSVVVLCAQRALATEAEGRARMDEKDEVLATLRQRVLSDWRSMPWSVIRQTPEIQGSVAELPESGGWALAASARHGSDVSPIVVSAWIERGRDGVDVPLAGLVAGSAIWASGRLSPWLEIDPASAEPPDDSEAPTAPVVSLRTLPVAPLVGTGVTIGSITTAWGLDDGWRGLFERLAARETGHSTGSAVGTGEGLAPGTAVSAAHGERGATLEVPQEWGTSPDDPGLLVVTGGPRLDAGGRGDLYGVMVVDDGDVLLDGTVLHGGLFATGEVDFGGSGEVVFSRPILRWATDRSLIRARLVPGTRSETIE